MDIAFVVDPLDDLKAYKDTSIAMMRAAAARGHRIHAFEQSDITWTGGRVEARSVPLTVHADNAHWYDAGEPETRALNSFGAVLMRKDPPFDMEYVNTTYLLELAEAGGARVFNRPRSAPSWPSITTSSSNRSTAWAARRSSACARTIPTSA